MNEWISHYLWDWEASLITHEGDKSSTSAQIYKPLLTNSEAKDSLIVASEMSWFMFRETQWHVLYMSTNYVLISFFLLFTFHFGQKLWLSAFCLKNKMNEWMNECAAATELTVEFVVHATTRRDGNGVNKFTEFNEARLQTTDHRLTQVKYHRADTSHNTTTAESRYFGHANSSYIMPAQHLVTLILEHCRNPVTYILTSMLLL